MAKTIKKVQEVKTKEFQMDEKELLKFESANKDMQILQLQMQMVNGKLTTIINDFCKRVGQKPENIIQVGGKIHVPPNGKITFKEV